MCQPNAFRQTDKVTRSQCLHYGGGGEYCLKRTKRTTDSDMEDRDRAGIGRASEGERDGKGEMAAKSTVWAWEGYMSERDTVEGK